MNLREGFGSASHLPRKSLNLMGVNDRLDGESNGDVFMRNKTSQMVGQTSFNRVLLGAIGHLVRAKTLAGLVLLATGVSGIAAAW